MRYTRNMCWRKIDNLENKSPCGPIILKYIYMNKISKEDELGMILFEKLLEYSYKSPGVFNAW